MNNEEKIYSILEKMHITINEKFESIEERLENIEGRFDGFEERLESIEGHFDGFGERLISIENIVLKIENDHGQKLGALFDGYSLNSEKLDRIEKEVSKHEEIILRRI